VVLEHAIDRGTRRFDEYGEPERGVDPPLAIVQRLE
jgi:hypothetical protein